MPDILLIDDDVELCELLQEFLSGEQCAVHPVHNGEAGLEAALQGSHDLVVLDIMLPGMNGLDVLRRIREQSNVPVLMLTARGEDVDRILGLEIGADDYLPKPFNPRELAARIRAILRRPHTSQKQGEQQFQVGDLQLSVGKRTVHLDGALLELTSVEFDVLAMLVEHAGEVVERTTMFETILERSFTPFDRSIDVHVSKLRKKLGPGPDGRERIASIRGVGYSYTALGEQP